MMEPQIWDGATNLGLGTLRNKLGITEPHQLSIAEAERTAFRLTQLRTAPIRGGFDSIHLLEIHHHIYQDLYDWAGELRPGSAGSQTV
jgi:cell filamentation protein